MDDSKGIRILTHAAIHARVKRIVYEIYEKNYLEEKLVVIGIAQRGGYIAELLTKHLKEISSIQVVNVSAVPDRNTASNWMSVSFSESLENLRGRVCLVVDDVLYTGRTMLHVVARLLEGGPSKIQIAVLIDRGHRSLPISPDYVGVELATTLRQHVTVTIGEENKVEAFLT